MYLEFLLRNCQNRKTECAIFIPIAYWWQEGPHDINIQFGTIGTQNYSPILNTNEEYILPNPQDPTSAIIAYHLGIVPDLPEKQDHHYLADQSYIDHLKSQWISS